MKDGGPLGGIVLTDEGAGPGRAQGGPPGRGRGGPLEFHRAITVGQIEARDKFWYIGSAPRPGRLAAARSHAGPQALTDRADVWGRGGATTGVVFCVVLCCA